MRIQSPGRGIFAGAALGGRRVPTGTGGWRGARGVGFGTRPERTRVRIVHDPARASIAPGRYPERRGEGEGSIDGRTCTAGCASRSIRLSRFWLSERSVENARGGSGLPAARVTTPPRMPRRLLESTTTALTRRATPAGDEPAAREPNMRTARGWLNRTAVEAGMVCMVNACGDGVCGGV